MRLFEVREGLYIDLDSVRKLEIKTITRNEGTYHSFGVYVEVDGIAPTLLYESPNFEAAKNYLENFVMDNFQQ